MVLYRDGGLDNWFDGRFDRIPGQVPLSDIGETVGEALTDNLTGIDAVLGTVMNTPFLSWLLGNVTTIP
jgi:hypothetical protein